jgi:hypothetical protein
VFRSRYKVGMGTVFLGARKGVLRQDLHALHEYTDPVLGILFKSLTFLFCVFISVYVTNVTVMLPLLHRFTLSSKHLGYRNQTVGISGVEVMGLK